MVDCWSAVAVASPVMCWVIERGLVGRGGATESIEPTLADTEASIGAATLALRRHRAVDRSGEVGLRVEVDVDVEQVAV